MAEYVNFACCFMVVGAVAECVVILIGYVVRTVLSMMGGGEKDG